MKRLLIPIILSTLLAYSTGVASEKLSESLPKSFINYYSEGGFQEKLYLVTDKPYYSAGDTIYFSAFLVNSIYFNQTTASKFIYVELISATGEVVTRLKVLGEDGRFSNAIPLSARMTAGRYTLRAYTRWQTNFDKDLLFTREIVVGNYIDDTIQTNFAYEFDGTGRVHATVAVTNNTYTPVTDRPIEYSLRINGRNTLHNTITDDKGCFRFSFRPTSNATDCIRLNINANGRKLTRTIQLPSFKDDFSVKFLPEGGDLIADIDQVVAFRAVGTDGHPVEIEGSILTKSGEEVCKIASQHDGMGKFQMKADARTQYIAKVTTKSGVSRTFELPAPQPSGCVIRLINDGSKRAMVRLLMTPDLIRSDYALVVQSRGIVEYVVEETEAMLRIPIDKLRSGVAMISIVNKPNKRVVAERLFFVRGKRASLNMMSSVSRIVPRSKVTLDFNLRNSSGNSVQGDFVVAVTDSDIVKKNPNADNILSYLLLNSDLRGNIENPTYYFEDDDNKRNEYLDLVMLTHGWRRYDLNNILASKRAAIKHLPEDTQSITGQIMGLSGKARNASVMIYRNRKEFLGVHPLNKSSRFSITGIDSPDTTTYFLQALNREGESSRMRIKIDPIIYPITPVIKRSPFQNRTFSSIAEEYLVHAKRNYYDEGGTPIIDIEEVVVTAQRIANYEYSSTLNDFNTISGDMTRFVSVFDALQRFRQLEIAGNSVSVRSKHIEAPTIEVDEENLMDIGAENEAAEKIPNVWVNGQQMDENALDAYPMTEITSISYLDKDESLAAGLGGEYGNIILQVRDINARQQYIINSIAQVVVPGYCAPAEFYAPDYSVANDPAKRDNRTTIAWHPLVKANSLGDASISFYTADRESDYRVIVEGITSEGELICNEMIIPAK